MSNINGNSATADVSVPTEAGDSQCSEAHKPKSIYRGSNSISVIDKAALSSITSDGDDGRNEASNRIDELVKSGEIDKVLHIYDVFQAWAKKAKTSRKMEDAPIFDSQSCRLGRRRGFILF